MRITESVIERIRVELANCLELDRSGGTYSRIDQLGELTNTALQIRLHGIFNPVISRILHSDSFQPYILDCSAMAAFGWSVGDCVTACILIKDVIAALNDSRGSVVEYNEICRELWSLDRALLEVHQLANSSERSVELHALRQTVGRAGSQCKDCIEAFLKKIQGFHRTLRDGGSGGLLQDAFGKIKWSITQKDELAKFRGEITAHASAINMLLITASM